MYPRPPPVVRDHGVVAAHRGASPRVGGDNAMINSAAPAPAASAAPLPPPPPAAAAALRVGRAPSMRCELRAAPASALVTRRRRVPAPATPHVVVAHGPPP